MKTWPLQDAKNQFSHLVELALTEGPQTVTRHGEPVAVIVAAEEYKRVTRPEGNRAGVLALSRIRHSAGTPPRLAAQAQALMFLLDTDALSELDKPRPDSGPLRGSKRSIGWTCT